MGAGSKISKSAACRQLCRKQDRSVKRVVSSTRAGSESSSRPISRQRLTRDETLLRNSKSSLDLLVAKYSPFDSPLYLYTPMTFRWILKEGCVCINSHQGSRRDDRRLRIGPNTFGPPDDRIKPHTLALRRPYQQEIRSAGGEGQEKIRGWTLSLYRPFGTATS